MSSINFWVKVEPSMLWKGLLFLVLCALAYYFARRYWQRRETQRQDQVFYRLVDRIGLDPEEEKRLVDLVERQQIPRPSRIIETLREYDTVAEKEMATILRSSKPWPEKLRTIDKLYSARDKIQRHLAEREHGLRIG